MRSALPAVVFLVAPVCAASAQQPPRAVSIERAFLAVAGRVHWPGFDAASIPLAIYDGQTTTLFRHPAPPQGFAPLANAALGAVMTGRHPAITANSSADIGGRGTATLMVDANAASRDVTGLAAVALHEAFHVFQREHHQEWVGNEADMFTYPVDDARRLALRRLETDALRKAQLAVSARDASCWARAFVTLRAARYDGLDSAFSNYERLTELNEGLANYIQTLANGKHTVTFPADEFAASAVRLRTYTTGSAIALLLDRVSPRWQESLEAHDQNSLDRLLAAALSRRPASANACAHSARERDNALRVAQADSAAIATSRSARRVAFDARGGRRLVVVAADGAPLWPQGFDPLNVERVNGGVLHARYLKLGNDAGSIELIDEEEGDIEAFTVGAGAHPLFNGVQRLSMVGFAAPKVREQADTVTIVAKGVKLSLRGAALRRSGDSLVVLLAKPAAGAPQSPLTTSPGKRRILASTELSESSGFAVTYSRRMVWPRSLPPTRGPTTKSPTSRGSLMAGSRGASASR